MLYVGVQFSEENTTRGVNICLTILGDKVDVHRYGLGKTSFRAFWRKYDWQDGKNKEGSRSFLSSFSWVWGTLFSNGTFDIFVCCTLAIEKNYDYMTLTRVGLVLLGYHGHDMTERERILGHGRKLVPQRYSDFKFSKEGWKKTPRLMICQKEKTCRTLWTTLPFFKFQLVLKEQASLMKSFRCFFEIFF